MMAYGRLSNQKGRFDRSDVREYVASERVYRSLRLQPLIIKTEDSLSRGWSMELDEGSTFAASGQGIYEVSSLTGELDRSGIVDAIQGMYAVMDVGAPPDIVLVPIKPSDIPKSRTIPIKKAIKIFTDSLPHTSSFYEAEYQAIFRNKASRGFGVDNMLWNLVSAILGDEQIMYASLFLASAFRDFVFWGDEIEQTILRSEEKPQRITEAVNVENALHNCYKVIEAIYGGALASDWDKVKRLRDARDDKAAHGRIHANRKSTYYELMDYQQLARHVLSRHIAFKYPTVDVNL